MNTAEDAVAFFRSRGFHVAWWPWMDSGYFVVGVRAELPPAAPVQADTYSAANVSVVRCSHAFGLGETWTVRSDDMTIRDFACLADAVNAVLARLEAWLAEHPDEQASS
jgi:hypothetical protein